MALSMFNEFYEPRLGRMERTLESMLGSTFGDLAAPAYAAPATYNVLAPQPSAHVGHAFDIVEKKVFSTQLSLNI